MDAWLGSAIGYIEMWLAFQMRLTDQPGCTIAIAKGREVVHEKSFGLADLTTGEELTPRHKFRVASHSKTFTATAILKLKEQGRLRLDDPVGHHVKGLHPGIAAVTLSQLLSHGGGLSRDCEEGGYFTNLRPFPSKTQLLAELEKAPVIEPGLRPKYSNLGFGLLGLVIENVTGESYDAWVTREVIAAAGLRDTTTELQAVDDTRLARGHTGRLPLPKRRIIPADNPTLALAPATGFVSTASDLARFYAQLSPDAQSSILSPESRREMVHPHRPDAEAPVPRAYGLGIFCANVGSWNNFGHLGRFQGSITRTAMVPVVDVTVVVLTNAIDGPASVWLDGIVHILRTFHDEGVPDAGAADWTGRWWNLWGPLDFVATGSHVRAFSPAAQPPFAGASHISLSGSDQGRITRAPAAERPGEAVVRARDQNGAVRAIRIGGQNYVTEAELTAAAAEFDFQEA